MRAYSLMYHDVVPAGAFEASGFPGGAAAVYKLEQTLFDDHLQKVTEVALARGHERVCDPAALARRAPDRPPAVLLHFDDGGKSALDVADRLEQHGWRGWFHITTDRIDTPGFVATRDVRELAGRGHIVGSHSCSHPPRMSALAPGEIEREWRDSVARLSAITGTRIAVGSVPGGYSSREVVLAADRAGLEVLFHSEPVSTFQWVRGLVVLGRYAIWGATAAAQAAAMAAGERAPRWRQWALWNAKKVAKAAGGETWLAWRKQLLDRRADRARPS